MEMEEEIEEIKPLIRSILLALGRRATKMEFLREYYNTEGEKFHNVLQKFNLSFYQFMKRMPDVCQVTTIGDEVYINRVSTEESSHMDHLTIEKRRKRSPLVSRTTYGASTFPRRAIGTLPPSYVTRPSNPYRFGQHIRLATNLIQPRLAAPSRLHTSAGPPMKTVVYKPKSEQPPASVGTTTSLPPMRTVSYKEGRPDAPQKVTVTVNRTASLPPLPPMQTVVYKPQEPVQPINGRPPMKTIVYKPIESSTEDKTAYRQPRTQSTPTHNKALSPSKSLNSRLSRLNFSSNDSLESWQSTQSVVANTRNGIPDLPSSTSSDSSTYSVSELKYFDSKENIKPRFRQLKVPTSNVVSPKSIVTNRTKLDNKEETKDQISTYNLLEFGDSPMKSMQEDPISPTEIQKIREELDPMLKRMRRSFPQDGYSRYCRLPSLSDLMHPSNPFNSKPAERLSLANCRDFRERLLKLKEKQQAKAEPEYIKSSVLKAVKNPIFFKLDVVGIISPSEFLFKFHSEELAGLTEEMNCYYKSGKGSVPEEVVLGSYAALIEGDWLRVTVDSVEGNEALVFLEDFGRLAKVDVKDIRHLERSFLAPSAKAARGALFGIKPKDQQWSPDAIDVFKTIMTNSELFGSIRGQNPNSFALSVAYKEKTSIADVLVLLGHAEAYPNAVGSNFIFVPSS